MSPSIILHQSTKSIFVAYSERELTFEVNLPRNLGELTFKNTSKWVIDKSPAASWSHLFLNPFTAKWLQRGYANECFRNRTQFAGTLAETMVAPGGGLGAGMPARDASQRFNSPK